jgi:hypothetical protein
MNLGIKGCKDLFMLDYIKKRACVIGMPLLRYVSAFGEGLHNVRCNSYSSKNVCSKTLRAYRDGIRMRKKGLTQPQVGDSIREH